MMIGRSVSWCFHHQWFGSHGGEAGDKTDSSCSGHHGMMVRSSKEFLCWNPYAGVLLAGKVFLWLLEQVHFKISNYVP